MRLLVLAAISLMSTIVACGSLTLPNPEKDKPAPASYFNGAITLELKAPSEVRQHEQLRGLDVVMTNHGATPFTFYYSGDLLDFEAMDGAGRLVWKHLKVVEMPLGKLTLLPGEAKSLSELHLARQGQWDLRDRQGFPAQPGEHQIKGIVTLHLQDPAHNRQEERLETAAHKLTVREAPLPAYAQAIKLELTAPAQAQLSE